MRTHSYRTMDNLIEGAVITLVDIAAPGRPKSRCAAASIRPAPASARCIDGRFLFANEWLGEMLGYSREELMRMRVTDLTDPEDMPRLQEQFDALARGDSMMHTNKRYICKDGSRLRLHERVSMLRDASGHAPVDMPVLSFDPRRVGAAS